jgi:hypothetical protein
MLALFGGRVQFDPLDPITPGETGTITGWEAGRIPEPVLEHIVAAAASLITHSNHCSPLGSYGGSMSSVRPSDQTDEHEKRTVHFVLCRYKMPCLWQRFRSRGIISPTSRLSLTDKCHDLKIGANFIILMLEVLKAITSFYCRGI